MKTIVLFLTGILISCSPLFSQPLRHSYYPANQDTSLLPPGENNKRFFDRNAVKIGLAPAIFFTASGLSWGERKNIREIRNRYIPNFSHHYDNFLQYAPGVSVYGLKLAGVKGRNDIGRAAVSHAASMVIMGILVNSIKYSAKVERPDGSRANSFPSGHTSNAFTQATFLHKEYGQVSPMYSIAGYTMSTLTGLGRNLNNRHWISDVLAGAGIGILSTQLGYFLVNKIIYKNEGDRPEDYVFPDADLRKPSFLALKLGYAHSTRNLVAEFSEGARSKGGFEVGLEGAYYPGRHWGIGGQISFTSFPISTDDLIFDDEEIGQISAELITQSIGTLNFTVGPHFTHRFNPQTLLQLKAGAGISGGAKGQVSVKVREEFDDSIEEDEIPLLSYEPSSAFRLNGGAALTRMLGEELGITLYADYNYSKPDFAYYWIDDLDDSGNPVKEFAETLPNKVEYLSLGLRLTAFF